MKKTISLAALVISASNASLAFIAPPTYTESKTYCLNVYTDINGAQSASRCDMSRNNELEQSPIASNGCAGNQIALTTTKSSPHDDFPIVIHPCIPPNAAQL